jgi:FkbM family methyltransferase
MVTLNPEIIKVPAFMTKFVNVDEMSFLSKLKLILKGKLTAFIFKKASNNFICKYLNLFFKFNGKLIYEESKFIKINQNSKLYYPNLRITRVLLDEKYFLEHLYDSYLLNNIDFNDQDLVIDCGANVGELFLSIKSNNPNIQYIGFEPDDQVFECLQLNTNSKSSNICLSNESGEKNFFIDSLGANSSVYESEPGMDSMVVKVEKLENLYPDTEIKLLKIDAEGSELEVLEGSKKIFNNIDYISVDCGAEKGVNQDTTFVDVNNYLISNNYSLIGINQNRLICLYRYNRV